jgi:hypothetical protein
MRFVGGASIALCGVGMPHKSLTGPKVAGSQRYYRFVAMTQRIGSFGDVKGFEKAFKHAFETAVACRKRPAGIKPSAAAAPFNALKQHRVGARSGEELLAGLTAVVDRTY